MSSKYLCSSDCNWIMFFTSGVFSVSGMSYNQQHDAWNVGAQLFKSLCKS